MQANHKLRCHTSKSRCRASQPATNSVVTQRCHASQSATNSSVIQRCHTRQSATNSSVIQRCHTSPPISHQLKCHTKVSYKPISHQLKCPCKVSHKPISHQLKCHTKVSHKANQPPTRLSGNQVKVSATHTYLHGQVDVTALYRLFPLLRQPHIHHIFICAPLAHVLVI